MPQYRNEYLRKGRPFGRWRITRDLEEQDHLERTERDQRLGHARQRLAGRCACCTRRYKPEYVTSGICRGCAEHVRCLWCGERFQPSAQTDRNCCASCRERNDDLWSRWRRVPCRIAIQEFRAAAHFIECPLWRS